MIVWRMCVCWFQVHAGEAFGSVLQLRPVLSPLQQRDICTGKTLSWDVTEKLKVKPILYSILSWSMCLDTRCLLWLSVTACLTIASDVPPSHAVLLQRPQRGIHSEEDGGRSLAAPRYVVTPRKPFITHSRKLISSAGHGLPSNLSGMFFDLCVCLLRRQASGVCWCGAGAVHTCLHGAVWPILLLWGCEALGTSG